MKDRVFILRHPDADPDPSFEFRIKNSECGTTFSSQFTNCPLCLKRNLRLLTKVDALVDADIWFDKFLSWKEYYSYEIGLLSSRDRVESDTKKAYRVIENAYPNMFHHLRNKKIPKTSNALEGYFTHLKRLYHNHAGFRNKHLNQYLSWYTYFKNI